MRIGIDALFIHIGKLGGIEFYFRNLFNALIKNNRINKYYVFVNKKTFDDLYINNSNVHFVPCNLSGFFRVNRVLWEHFILPFQWQKRGNHHLISSKTIPLRMPRMGC